jgi:hypothetical protein
VHKVRKINLEHRGHVFQENWETYCFSVVSDTVVCLICSRMVSSPNDYNLRRSYENLLKDKFGVFNGKLLVK